MAKLGRKLRRGSKETVRVELPALPDVGFDVPEWVDLKKTLGRDDERQRQKLSMHGIKIENDKDGQVSIAGEMADLVIAAELAHLTVAIQQWSFDETVSMETIALLEEPWLDLLKAKCEELHPAPLTEEEAKNSEGG